MKTTLDDMLNAELIRSRWLQNFHRDMAKRAYIEAMHSQLQYLYWTDEYLSLFYKHSDAYWDLRALARGSYVVA
jgi:hypothetical protein